MREDHYDLSCFLCFEVSQASYTQDESITPRYFNMSWKELPQSMGHRTKRFFQWSGKMGERL